MHGVICASTRLTLGKEFVDNAKIYNYYLEEIDKKRYNNTEELKEAEKYLLVISSKTFYELYLSLKNLYSEEIIEKIVMEVELMSTNEEFVRYLEDERKRDYDDYLYEEEVRKQGEKRGKKEGRKEVLTNLFKNGFSLEEIAKMTKMKLSTIKSIML